MQNKTLFLSFSEVAQVVDQGYVWSCQLKIVKEQAPYGGKNTVLDIYDVLDGYEWD